MLLKTEIPFRNFQSEKSIHRYEKTQEHIVKDIISSPKGVVMLSAPTGLGKSIIGMMAGNTLAPKVNYVCSDKALQDQLVKDFPEAVVLKGRSNYECNLYPHLTADSCVEKCESYEEGDIPCNYYDQKQKLLAAKFRILNTYYLLFEMNYAGQLSKQDVIIIDEADTLDNIFTGFVGLGVTDGQIKKYDLDYPKITVKDSWVEWAEKSVKKLKYSYNTETFSNALDQEFVKADKLIKKLQLFLRVVEDDWIYNKGQRSSEFKPVWMSEELSKKYLFNHAKKFILMSATLPPKAVICETLCIDILDCDYIEVGSVFKPENRIVKYIPTMDMGFKNKDKYFTMTDKINEIVASHPDEKGIIHSQSYRLNELIMTMGDSDRLITHDSTNKQEVLEYFINSTEPLVFVSPSSVRGISLDGDKARFGICPKIPFGNLGDKATAARLYGSGPRGQRWYNAEAAQAIVQLAGRHVRNYEDYGVTYILDTCFTRVRKLLPEWFREAIVDDYGW